MTVTIDPSTVTEDLTYTANWEATEYTITYNLDGGTIEGETEETKINPIKYTIETEDITLVNPTKEGYRFTGWTGTDIGEMTEEVRIQKGSTGDREYTANWEEEVIVETYTITYNLGDGEVEGNPNEITTDGEEITLNNPSKNGYTFIGWTGSNGETAETTVTIDPSTVTENLTYTANWEIRTDLSYTVNYLEKNTNKVLHEAKTQENQTFGNVIRAIDEVIIIPGYQYENADKETLEITTGENTINLYYTQKRAQIIVHHYIYDEEAETENDKYTTTKLVEDEIIERTEGEEYSTSKSDRVSANYICIDEEPEGFSGTITNEDIEVSYYYSLTKPTIENNITTTVNIGESIVRPDKETQTAILTKEDGIVTYDIDYHASIKNYIGKATIEIVDTLPANIDIDKSELADGRYDEQKRTITWTEQINNINTFVNGDYTKNITKQIKVVYENQDVTQNLVNSVTGRTITYYPERHLDKGGEVVTQNSATETKEIQQDYRVNFKLIKVWNDNEDIRHRRPESVTIEIRVMPNDRAITRQLNEENNWTYEEKGLPKYNARGEEITYVITESETEEGDLKYYDEAVIDTTKTQDDEATNYTATVTNVYKLVEANFNMEISKMGTEEITSRENEIEYTINLKAEVEDYTGNGKVTIVDTLPYKIDLGKSNIQNGTYDSEKQTITWEEEIQNINTDESGESHKIDLTKQITLSYIDIDLTQDKMTNTVTGKIELYDTDEKDEKTASFDTNINVTGKVIVKYLEKGTEKELHQSYEIVDKIGKDYNAEKKDIAGYINVETINDTGKIKEKDQEAIYYYENNEAEVIVKYQDKDGKDISEQVSIKGNVGDTYKTEKKDIDKYKYVEVKGNPEGTMTKEKIEVIYVYEENKDATLIVKYLDIETEEEITYKEENAEGILEEKKYSYEIKGLIGDKYETKELEIPYYVFVKNTDNTEGELKEDTVIYYYRKLECNFEIENTIRSIKLDNKNVNATDNKLVKIDVKTGDVNKTELIVEYSIKVRNNGELAGTATVLDIIPSGYEIKEAPEYWKETKTGTLETKVELEPGESRDLSLTLKWSNSENNLGSKTNVAKITDVENVANYENINTQKESSEVTIIVAIKTGVVVSSIIIVMILVSFAICTWMIVLLVRKMNKGEGINKIKFLNK